MKPKLTSLAIAAACLPLLCATPISLRAATLTVTSTADSGTGSLREALASANPYGGDTVNFSVTGTIRLTSGQLSVNHNLTIAGPGAGLLTVSGNNAVRVFDITGPGVTISGLTIANGHGALYGAGIRTGGSPGSILTLNDCILTHNSTTLDGGGIYNSSGLALTVSNCTFSGNSASGDGGGIYLTNSTLTLLASTLSGNSAGFGGGIMKRPGRHRGGERGSQHPLQQFRRLRRRHLELGPVRQCDANDFHLHPERQLRFLLRWRHRQQRLVWQRGR